MFSINGNINYSQARIDGKTFVDQTQDITQLQQDVTQIQQDITGITYNNINDTTTIDNNLNVTKTATLSGCIVTNNLSIPSYNNVKTALDTLFTRTTNQVWTSNNTTFETDYVKVGYTQANATPIFILGKTPNIFNPSISTFVRNGLYFTSPTPTPPAVGIGMVSVIDQLWDCGVNVSNVGTRDSSKQGVQFRFDSRNTEKVFQIQTQEKVTNIVRVAIAALDNGHIDIEYRLNMLANANIQMSTGTGIINQITGGTGTNQLKATNIYSTLSIPSYSDVGATLTSYGNSITNINTTLNGISYISGTDTTNIDNNLNISGVLSIPNYLNVESTLTNYGNSISNINTSLNDLSGITYTAAGDLTTIDNNLTVTKDVTFSTASTTALRVVGQTTIGSAALTTAFNGRAFNVIDGTGGIRLGRTSAANAPFIELYNISNDGLTANNISILGGSTSTDQRFRFFFRPVGGGSDVDALYIRTTGSTLSTNLEVVGNITQSSSNIISQSGTGINLMKDITMNATANLTMQTSGVISQTGTGTNTLKNVTLRNDNILTLQGVGHIVFEDGSKMRTYDEQPVSDIDMHDYLQTRTSLTSTFDLLYASNTLFSAATSNTGRFAAVKLKRGDIINGVGFYCGTAALHRVALYQKGATAARLAQSNQFTTTANSMNYGNFTATYTIPTTDFYYVALVQNAASQTYAVAPTNDRINYGNNTITTGSLTRRAQSGVLSGGTFPANILNTQTFSADTQLIYFIVY